MTNPSKSLAPMQGHRIWVVIINYRTAQLTLDCLSALAAEQQSIPLSVVVVDNASGDRSVEFLASEITARNWEDWISLQPLSINGGFSFGNNVAIRQALQSSAPPAYILLLNPDTVAQPGAIAALAEFLDAHPEVGIAGSRLEDPDGTPQYSAFRFPSFWNELDQGIRLGVVSKLLLNQLITLPLSDHPCPADWLAGASLMVRREVFESVGLMDEAYFLYFEEVDFCRRAKQADWGCWYVPQSRVVHLVGQSSGVTDTKKAPQRRPQYWFNSRRRYFLKHHGWIYSALTDLGWMTGFALWRMRRVLQQKPDPDPPHFLQDFLQNSVWVRNRLLQSKLSAK
ncbi:MAG: glycosyltransferase family 2 protein [Thermosynechococcaceae cyanobacterium MS004]|nr:glycosyltransferase family 2 protein [Thermosynechococcaceae cyanobacterium MS004]